MTQTFTLQFLHRLNEDRAIDSICRECSVTVATALSNPELDREERKHNCALGCLKGIRNAMHSEKFLQC